MKMDRYLARLEKIVGDDLADLEKKSIFSHDGVYHVFGRYTVSSLGDRFAVTKKGEPVLEFGSLRSALGWCSADHLGKTMLARDILNLEQQRQMANADLVARNHTAQKIRDPQRRDSAEVKVAHRRQQIRHIENQLDKCIDLAKYWQIQGFHNETARTGRTASNRTN